MTLNRKAAIPPIIGAKTKAGRNAGIQAPGSKIVRMIEVIVDVIIIFLVKIRISSTHIN